MMKRMNQRNAFRLYMAGLLLSALVCAIAANSAAGFLTDRFDIRFDMTQSRMYELSGSSRDILAAGEGKIVIYTLFRTGAESKSITNLLDKIESSSQRVSSENIDPVKNPNFTDQFDSMGLGIEENSIIVTGGDNGRYKVILPQQFYTLSSDGTVTGFAAEQRIISAIDYVDTGKQRRALLLQGHGETPSVELGAMGSLLALNNYILQDYNLSLSSSQADPETDAIIMLEPKTDISESDYDKLTGFMKNGGRLIVCSGPVKNEFVNLGRLLAKYGLSLGDGVIVEKNAANYVEQETVIVPRMAQNDVTFALAKNKLAAIFPSSRPVTPAQAAGENTSAAVILASTEQSFLSDIAKVVYEKDANAKTGPFALGVAAVEKIGESDFSYILVYGCSKWITDEQMFQNPGNYNLLLSSLSWLYSSEKKYEIAPKPVGANTLAINNKALRTGISAVLLVLVPLCFVAAGIITVVQRRKK